MKKLFVFLTALLLGLTSSYAMANIIWVKKPDFSYIDYDNIGLQQRMCYDIKMAYFNDCEPLTVRVNAVLHVNKKGGVTRVDGVNTGDKNLDWYIIKALKRAQLKPFMKDGVAVKGKITMPIHLELRELNAKRSPIYHTDTLRDICAKDDKCDSDELENALKRYGDRVRQNCQAYLGFDDCVPLDLALREKGL